MQHIKTIGMLFAIFMVMGLIMSCGSNNSTSPGTNTRNIKFTDYEAKVKDIIPDPFSPSASTSAERAPLTINPMWYEGQEAILNKVLGEDHSQSIFFYLEQFQNTIANIEDLLEVDDSGNLFADTSWMHLYDLSTPTPIPLEARAVLGNSIMVEHWIDVEFETDVAGKVNHIGFTKNDDEETILLYNYFPPEESDGGTRSWIFYAHFDPSDSSIVMKGVDYKELANGKIASEVFDIHTVNLADFAYRLSWYSDEIVDPEPTTFLGCIVGGGNRNTEFALRYRQFMPADAEDYDSMFMLDQVFNSDYSEGTSLISSYSSLVDESLIFRIDDVPTQQLPSPWEQ